MRLDAAEAVIRRRSPWEGVDLGLALGRHWFLRLWGLWWLSAAPVAVLAVAALHDYPQALTALLWWLKPLYEPLLLFWLSRRLFGEELTLRPLLVQWRRIWLPRLLPNLLWRRLGPNRSLYMPVSHLEGLRGHERGRRMALLGRGHRAGTWLTVGGAHIEAFLYLGAMAGLTLLVPEPWRPYDLSVVLGQEPDTPWFWLDFLVWLLAMSVMAPFYVAGGLGLYLSRRTELEAWDVELAFRRLQPRWRGAGGAGAALTLVVVAVFAVPAPVRAAEPAPEAVRQAVAEVLADEDFGRTEPVTRWRYVGGDAPSVDGAAIGAWVSWLAEVLRVAFWFVVVLGGAYLVYRIAAAMRWLRPAPVVAGRSAGAAVVPRGPAAAPALPADIPAAARASLAGGDGRAALALLYRGALAALAQRHGLVVPGHATEGECRRLVAARRPGPEADFFADLAALWMAAAYARRTPPVEQVEALCDDWQRLYGARHADG